MPEPKIDERGGTARAYTVRIGKGKRRKYLKVAIVRKHGPARTPKGT
jgi:hypothetical protein